MCGIIGYVGERNAKDLLLRGLERLEYRGYDSAGLCLFEDDGLDYVRAVGNLDQLKAAAGANGSHATVGVGHTRWATHGRVSLENAHPLAGSPENEVAVVLYGIVDRVVDDYLPVVRGLEYDIEEVEAEVFSSVRTNPVERIYYLKREVLEFRRGTAPLLMPLNQLAIQPIAVIRPEVREYFRDVYDHLLRVNEQVESFRDLLTSILEANLTQMNIRQNEDMRRISAWVAIAVVPTMIAGIYGMNFEHMPELRSPVGYPLVLLGMLVICTGMYVFFRKRDWL